MRSLIQRLAHEPHQVSGTILAVGAGCGTDLPELRKLGSHRTVLIEAHPQQSEELARRVVSSRGEEVWPLAVTAMPTSRAALFVLNNPRDSSLKVPDALCAHYPNLRVAREIEVPARSLGETIESLHLDAGQAHLLLLDAPGQAFDMLSATAPEILQNFTWVVLHCGVDALYRDDKSLDDILARLNELGFDVDSRDPEAIHPHASILLKRNDLRVRVIQLEAQLKVLGERQATDAKLARERQVEVEALNRDVANRTGQIDLLVRQREEQSHLAASLRADLDAAGEDAARQAAAIADRDGEIQRLVRERDEQSRIAAQRKHALAELIEARTTQDKQLADRDATVSELIQECDEQTRLASERATELEHALQANTEIHKRIGQQEAQLQRAAHEQEEWERLAGSSKAALEEMAREKTRLQELLDQREAEFKQLTAKVTELETMLQAGATTSESLRKQLAAEKQTSSLAVRMQVLREGDLEDLRQRFGSLSERYQSQHELLSKLGERLNVASNYFHQLASDETAAIELSERMRRIQPTAERSGER